MDDAERYQREFDRIMRDAELREGQSEKKSETKNRARKKVIERAANATAKACEIPLEEARAWVIAECKRRGLPT